MSDIKQDITSGAEQDIQPDTEEAKVDTRIRVSFNKEVNLAQLDEELGGHGLSSSDTEIVVVEGSPITKDALNEAINKHAATFSLSSYEIISSAVQALPNPANDLAGFKSGLIDILTNIDSK